MFHIRKFPNIIKKLQDIRHNIYLYYIRYNIYRARDIQDLINIIKNIAAKNKYITTDEIFTILTDSIKKYPLTDIELQNLSTWEQIHNSEGGEKNYVATVFWLCIIQAIQENEQPKLLL